MFNEELGSFYKGLRNCAPDRDPLPSTERMNVAGGVPHKTFIQVWDCEYTYRARNKGLQILLSNSQAGPGIKVKQEQ